MADGKFKVGGVVSHDTTVAVTGSVLLRTRDVLLEAVPLIVYPTEPDSDAGAALATNETRLVTDGLTVPIGDVDQFDGNVMVLGLPGGAGDGTTALKPAPLTVPTLTDAVELLLKVFGAPLVLRVTARSTSFVTVEFAQTLPNASAFVLIGVRPSPSTTASSANATFAESNATSADSATVVKAPVTRRIPESPPTNSVDASVSPLARRGPGDQIRPTSRNSASQRVHGSSLCVKSSQRNEPEGPRCASKS